MPEMVHEPEVRTAGGGRIREPGFEAVRRVGPGGRPLCPDIVTFFSDASRVLAGG